MTLNPTHPAPELLAAFDAGQLSPDDREAVERHVAECTVCCRFLERLPEDALATRIRDFAGRPTSVPADTPSLDPHATPTPVELVEGLRNHPRYRVLGPLGAGGMGIVYKAVQINLDRVVALKVLHRQLTDRPGFADRFRTEVKALARLNHPNVVAAYDADQAGELHFLVMEFVGGESLDAVVARRGPLPVGEACGLICQAAVGLQHAYEHGLVHRDVKPANLLLTPAGEVKVADFGLSRLVEGSNEPGSAPTVLGTPEYMAPEQAREPHRVDIRSDLYSLGCTLYFLLTGKPPFVGASRLQTLLDQQDKPPPTIPGLPSALSSALARLLAKEPASRFSTPAEVAKALGRAVGTVGTREVAVAAQPVRRRRGRLAVGGAVVVAALAVGGAIALAPRDRPADPQPPPSDASPAVGAELSRSEQVGVTHRSHREGDPVGPVALPRSEQLGPEVAPAPRLVNRFPLASPEELALMRKQSLNRMVEWVRVNNRWRPDAQIAVSAAAQVAELSPKVDGLRIMFGDGLLKSQTPTLVFARTGGFYVFELTDEQAQAVGGLKGMGEFTFPYTHPPDPRRAVPGVRLSDLRIEDANNHPPDARIDGTITCEFPVAPAAGSYLRISHYLPDGRRVSFLHRPKQVLPAGTVTIRFSVNPIEARTGKVERLVVMFADWVSDNNGARVIESNTPAVLLLVAASRP
jgi:hypothetical protein